MIQDLTKDELDYVLDAIKIESAVRYHRYVRAVKNKNPELEEYADACSRLTKVYKKMYARKPKDIILNYAELIKVLLALKTTFSKTVIKTDAGQKYHDDLAQLYINRTHLLNLRDKIIQSIKETEEEIDIFDLFEE